MRTPFLLISCLLSGVASATNVLYAPVPLYHGESGILYLTDQASPACPRHGFWHAAHIETHDKITSGPLCWQFSGNEADVDVLNVETRDIIHNIGGLGLVPGAEGAWKHLTARYIEIEQRDAQAAARVMQEAHPHP